MNTALPSRRATPPPWLKAGTVATAKSGLPSDFEILLAKADMEKDGSGRHPRLRHATPPPSPSPFQGGEAEIGKGPVDLFPAERAHRILVRPGRERGGG